MENRFPTSVDRPEVPARRALRIPRCPRCKSEPKRNIDPKTLLPRTYLPGDLVVVARILYTLRIELFELGLVERGRVAGANSHEAGRHDDPI